MIGQILLSAVLCAGGGDTGNTDSVQVDEEVQKQVQQQKLLSVRQQAELENLISELVFEIHEESLKKNAGETGEEKDAPEGRAPEDDKPASSPAEEEQPTESQAEEDPSSGFYEAPQAVNQKTVISLNAYAEVASKYIRVMDIVEFTRDPDRLQAILGSIIVCPFPEGSDETLVTRSQLIARLREYNVPLGNMLIAGEEQVVIQQVEAAAPEDPGAEEGLQGRSSESLKDNVGQDQAPGEGVIKNARITIVREGDYFRMEESGIANTSGSVGSVVEVTDKSGESFPAKVTGKNEVTVEAP